MSVRLFHRGARLVFVVRNIAPGDAQWWSPHVTTPDWGTILGNQLALLGLPSQPGSGGVSLSCRLGEIHWTNAGRWSIITLRLVGGSETKRRLVSDALLKGARYARPGH